MGVATIKDIARATGLGLATISKYLNGGSVRPANKAAIEAAIAEHRYTVNVHARGLKTKRSLTIGAVIPELDNVFIATIMSSVTDVLRRAGYGLLICSCRSDEGQERGAVRFLMGKSVDGIISMPTSQDGSHLREALDAGLVAVLIDRNVNALRSQASAVLVDNVAASAQATQALLDAGHTRIGIIVGPTGVFTSQQRLLGYHQAHMQSGLMPDPHLMVYGNYTLQGGRDAALELARAGATALFATNYEMTLGAIIALNELGVRIPEQMSFVGFDNMQLSEVIRPRLTIVTQPLREIGEQAARILLDRLSPSPPKEPACVILPAHLSPGESIAPPQKQATGGA
ncbi:MAG: LacI family transcriptional regulator [Clostridiales bacterium]|nr:LacI family transcriptional regulator [Clostridiales bacterium]